MVIKLKGSYIATFFKTLLLGYFYKESYQKVTGPKNQPESRNYWPARPETHHRDTTFKTKLSVFPTRIWNQGNSRFQSRYRTLQLPRKNKLNSFWVQFFFFFFSLKEQNTKTSSAGLICPDLSQTACEKNQNSVLPSIHDFLPHCSI